MAIITFSNINVSLQQGDHLYETTTTSVGGFDTASTVMHVGEITNVSGNVITVTGTPTPGSFFMFLKDPVVNLSSVVGEYAEVTLRNNSKEQAELFSLGSEISVSSK